MLKTIATSVAVAVAALLGSASAAHADTPTLPLVEAGAVFIPAPASYALDHCGARALPGIWIGSDGVLYGDQDRDGHLSGHECDWR